jgi:hypothetical protein
MTKNHPTIALNLLALLLGSMLGASNLGAQTVVWEDKSNGQLLFDCNPNEPGGLRFAPNNNLWGQSARIAENPCFDEPPVARALELSNWTSTEAPDSVNVNVVLAGSSPIISLLSDVSVSTLTIAETNELRIGSSGTLSVFGGVIQNDGRISLVEDFVFSSFLELNADTILRGAGITAFSSSKNN